MISISPVASNQISDYLKTKAKGLSLDKALSNSVHEAQIAKILYQHMPRTVRWVIKEPKFLSFFSKHKSYLLQSAASKISSQSKW